MADWVHCNSCFRQPGGGFKFSLTNCGHIYCERCTCGPQENCKMCHQKCNSIPLSAKMKPDVEIYFTDQTEIMKKLLKQVQQIFQVLDFQKNHRKRFTAYNRERLSKQTAMVQKAQTTMEQMKDLDRENMNLKKENSYLKKLLQSMGANPGRTPPLPPVAYVSGSLSPSPVQCHASGSTPSSQYHRRADTPTSAGEPSRHFGMSPGGDRFFSGLSRTVSPQGYRAHTPGASDRGNTPASYSPNNTNRRLLTPMQMPFTPNSVSPMETQLSAYRRTEASGRAAP